MVTGGANGIGNSTVLFFAKLGHYVLSVDIDEKNNIELKNKYPY